MPEEVVGMPEAARTGRWLVSLAGEEGRVKEDGRQRNCWGGQPRS